MDKKQMLFSMLESGKTKNFTIIGTPKKDVLKNHLEHRFFDEFLRAKGIELVESLYNKTDIAIYFPHMGVLHRTDRFAIIVNKKVSKEQYCRILDLFEDIFDFIQIDVNCHILNILLELIEEKLTFSDMLKLMKDSQSSISEKIGVSKQLISDVKKGRANLTLENLSLLMQHYPLLPWENFVRDFNKNDD